MEVVAAQTSERKTIPPGVVVPMEEVTPAVYPSPYSTGYELDVTPPVKTAAAKYEAYVDPGTPEANAVQGRDCHLKHLLEIFKV